MDNGANVTALVLESIGMIALISENLEAIRALCRKYSVRRLDLFGSAATGAFNRETSDLDFIVDLGGYERGVARRFSRFATALEELLRYNVDLLTDEEIENPYFRESVQRQRVNLYGTGDRQAAA